MLTLRHLIFSNNGYIMLSVMQDKASGCPLALLWTTEHILSQAATWVGQISWPWLLCPFLHQFLSLVLHCAVLKTGLTLKVPTWPTQSQVYSSSEMEQEASF